MKWGIFAISQVPDQSRRVEAFNEDFRQFQLAEDLGFDSIWIAEHLFSTYCITTSTQVLASAIARLTSRIRIGTAVTIIPFAHPLRTAADFGLVDVLSNGRLMFGGGRAYQPQEFQSLGLSMERSRAMFAEGMEIIRKAWTNPTVTHAGEFWTIPNETEVLPKPVQSPHPPIYMATSSPDSFELAAQDGYHTMIGTSFCYRVWREAWKDRLGEAYARFDRTCEALGRDPRASERVYQTTFFVDETKKRAEETFGRHLDWFYEKLGRMQGGPAEVVPSYELSMIEGQRSREMGYLHFDKLHEHGATIVGDPEYCIAQLSALKKRFEVSEFVLWISLGGIPAEDVERSMRLAAERVIPYV